MDLLTRVLYLLSSGLLIPVIVLLLLFFVRSLIQLGRTYGTWLSALRFRSAAGALVERLAHTDIEAAFDAAGLPEDARWTPAARRLFDHGRSPAHREKVIADFEASCERELRTPRTMARLGPMLGLMGTLIPMGPALVGLAAGDIATMAENLQVAFSTTVIGLFVGGVGFATHQAIQRWNTEALNDLEFISELIAEQSQPTEQGGAHGLPEKAAPTQGAR